MICGCACGDGTITGGADCTTGGTVTVDAGGEVGAGSVGKSLVLLHALKASVKLSNSAAFAKLEFFCKYFIILIFLSS